MDKNKILNDIDDIKSIMNRSSKLFSLSGYSGISAGIIALIGVSIAFNLIFKNSDFLVHQIIKMNSNLLLQIILIASCTILAAVILAIYFTHQHTKTFQFPIPFKPIKNFLFHLFFPLITGGLLCLLLLFKGYIGLLPSITLIFYGIALLNASKFTFTEIRVLAIIQILLGLLSFIFIAYSLLLWAFGFGVLHIVYGILIQNKSIK